MDKNVADANEQWNSGKITAREYYHKITTGPRTTSKTDNMVHAIPEALAMLASDPDGKVETKTEEPEKTETKAENEKLVFKGRGKKDR